MNEPWSKSWHRRGDKHRNHGKKARYFDPENFNWKTFQVAEKTDVQVPEAELQASSQKDLYYLWSSLIILSVRKADFYRNLQESSEYNLPFIFSGEHSSRWSRCCRSRPARLRAGGWACSRHMAASPWAPCCAPGQGQGDQHQQVMEKTGLKVPSTEGGRLPRGNISPLLLAGVNKSSGDKV